MGERFGVPNVHLRRLSLPYLDVARLDHPARLYLDTILGSHGVACHKQRRGHSLGDAAELGHDDPSRKRDPDTKEQIDEHQKINRAVAMAYAALTGSTVKIVFNHDNELDDAVKQASPVLK